MVYTLTNRPYNKVRLHIHVVYIHLTNVSTHKTAFNISSMYHKIHKIHTMYKFYYYVFIIMTLIINYYNNKNEKYS